MSKFMDPALQKTPSELDFYVYFTFSALDSFCKDKSSLFNDGTHLSLYYSIIHNLLKINTASGTPVLTNLGDLQPNHLSWINQIFKDNL